MSDEYERVHVPDIDPTPSAVSGTPQANLTEILGCEQMHPRVWYLSPGDEMSHHRQTEQEEFYYVLEGPGRIRIAEEIQDVPAGTALRIPPDTPRQILHDGDEGDEEHVWLVVGAPAVTDDGRPAYD
jgi:quercetin dioxygenase-like cupin family protein